MVNSAEKGGRGERYLIKLLREWWEDDSFKRSPESGAMATQLESIGAPQDIVGRLSGDILVPDNFPFCFESKFYKSINLYSLITNPDNCDITKWWLQCKNDAERANKIPVLFFRENNKQGYIAIRVDDVEEKLGKELTELPFGFFISPIKGEWVIITSWKKFSEYFKKDYILRTISR